MNRPGLVNLPLRARAAYAIMCFERYTAFVYSDVNFRPAAEIMWQLLDGRDPLGDSGKKLWDTIPEHLFAYTTYGAYCAAGNGSLTEDEFRALSRILNPHDRSLNAMMKHIYTLTAGLYHRPDEAETAHAMPACRTNENTEITANRPQESSQPLLEEITAMLRVRSVGLPDTELLAQYAVPEDAAMPDLIGSPVDPGPLSQLGITGHSAAPVRRTVQEEFITHNEDAGPNYSEQAAVGYDGFERSFAFGKDDLGDISPFFANPAKPVVEANGCEWEIYEEEEGITITKCFNRSYQKEVTVPAELHEKPVIAIEDDAFSNEPEGACMFIETLIMPDSVRQIGNRFFMNCTGLRQITLPAALESIGDDAFRGTSKLESLAVGDSCRFIGDFFCADAAALRSVTIGTGIEEMGQYSFYNTPAMAVFRCDGFIRQLGYGSFWVNRFADKAIFHPAAEMLRFCKDDALLYRYVKRNPPPRLFFDESIRYVYDFAFGGDAWNSGDGIREIYFPGAEIIGVNAFKKVPNATVHLSAARMAASYGEDYEYTLALLCEPAKIVFDLP
ncbi:MAG: leucine-rich repeat domain-containing protein [Oscillospiraceae bacterium]|nr:leucine-rich repeat domain-containing protein [Oscillospiraceae bacterium]